jgi:glycosyltransferase involved in cell wall biosynthesis
MTGEHGRATHAQGARGLRLGFVGQGWFPDIGGVESHTRDLARELGARGHRVCALALDGAEGLEPYSSTTRAVDGVRVTRMAYRYHDHRALADLVRAPRAEEVACGWARAEELDLVHVHHASGWGLGLLEALDAARFPVVMTLHDYWPLCPRGQMLRTDGEVCAAASPARCAPCLARTWPHLMPSTGGARRGPRGEELADDVGGDEAAARSRTEHAFACLGRAARLFTPSPATRAAYGRAGLDERRIEVVENGVDVEELARATRALRSRAAPHAGLRLGVLGTVLPSKGALELARAVLAANLPGLTLEIHGALPSYHGDARYVEELGALAARQPAIRVHGPFGHERLAEILSGLDGVAAPSRWNEVYGLTVREARAAGLPVLVSDAGALPDVVAGGRGGLVVPAEDRAAWVAALVRFADPAQRAAWAAHASLPRSARAMALQLERAYCEVVRAARGRLPKLEFEPGSERRARSGPWAWLRRRFGAR